MKLIVTFFLIIISQLANAGLNKDSLIRKANIQMDRKNWIEAIDLYKMLLNISPKDSAFLVNISRCFTNAAIDKLDYDYYYRHSDSAILYIDKYFESGFDSSDKMLLINYKAHIYSSIEYIIVKMHYYEYEHSDELIEPLNPEDKLKLKNRLIRANEAILAYGKVLDTESPHWRELEFNQRLIKGYIAFIDQTL